MVQDLWNDAEARQMVDLYAATHGEDVALRVYTSRLIGRDPGLVLHGGGNTSVKTTARDLCGDQLEVLAVKGSGWDLAFLEPPGLPLVEIAPLRRLLELDAMTDEQMVNEVRRRMLDATAPNPSVETLLHAALPHKFVDHTHADAVLVLTNQPDGAERIRAALGDRVAILPWIMPGFPLSKAVAAAYAENPKIEGIVLLHHGIFTFGDDARTSYTRMIELVDATERHASEHIRGATMTTVAVPDAPVTDADDPLDTALPVAVVRGAIARPREGGGVSRLIASVRSAPDLRAFSLHPDCARLIEQGPLTPDHVIRTKGRYLFLDAATARDPAACRARVAEYAEQYAQYFAAHKDRVAMPPKMLDPHPRVVVVAGLGLIAFGATMSAADIAGDIAEHTLRAKARAAAIGTYTALSPGELFDMEYWSLEQAKLGKKAGPELAGQVALVTGAAGAIGFGVCESLCAAGAAVVLADIGSTLDQVRDKLLARHRGAVLLPLRMDVTDAGSVRRGFAELVRTFGGVDTVVANAGIAHVSTLRDMKLDDFHRVLDVNLVGTMLVLREAARVFEAQGTGGSVVVQASKNVFAPGAAFGAYSASKAGQHQLGKIAALELAPLGVRVNMINADAVFGDQVESGLWREVGPERMKSRGLDPAGLRAYYRDRSLLGIEVTPKDVGESVVFLASDRSRVTTGVTLTVDGGVAAAFPR